MRNGCFWQRKLHVCRRNGCHSQHGERGHSESGMLMAIHNIFCIPQKRFVRNLLLSPIFVPKWLFIKITHRQQFYSCYMKMEFKLSIIYLIYTSISLVPFCPRYPFLPRMRFKRLFSYVFTLRSQKLDHLRVKFVASRTRLGEV